jgi:regulatory protein
MDAKKALSRAAAYCSRQERCVYDVERKLEAWDVDPDEFGAIIERLIKEKFIDESRYSVFFVRDKFRFNGWGRIKIRWALKQKGIAEKDINNALTEIDEPVYRERLTEILKGKYKQIKDKKDEYQTKAALVRFAQSKGYEQDLIFSVLDEIIKKD